MKRVSKSFDGTTVLHEVSLNVPETHSYVILGQSGVGKSVLLKTLAGLLVPDSGTVSIQTKDIGMLFQKNALFDSATVYENLEFPLVERTTLSHAQRREKILEFLGWVGLSGSEQKYPHELSGGMQKRLGIARALIVEPRVIFYDEPTAGLDPITSRVIIELIQRLRQEFKTTLVSVTSDVLRAYQLADRIGLLMRTPEGAILREAGTPEEARNTNDPAIRQFLAGAIDGPLTQGQDPVLGETDVHPF